MFNHLEYDCDTLADEFFRDRDAGEEIDPPANYFPDGDPAKRPMNIWRPYGNIMIRNWLAGIVADRPVQASDNRLLDWLVDSPSDDASSEILVLGRERPDTLSNLIRRVKELDLSLKTVRIHRQHGTSAIFKFQLNPMEEPIAQRLSRKLLGLDETHSVSYRNTDGTGGMFSTPCSARAVS